jgi:hypothetical protein
MRFDSKVIIATVFTLIPGILWCLEPWQGPGFLRVMPDAILLAIAFLGLFGLALVIARLRKSARRWRWIFGVCLCGFVLLGGMRLFFGKLALSQLESRVDQEILSPMHFDEPRKSISARLVGTLEWLKLGVPDWLSKQAQRPDILTRRSPEGLIASSRWPLRRAMADSMLRNPKRAEFLMQNWKHYFPAIIRADVSLDHRREWISLLNALREDDSLTAPSRQAAVFCMALIVLTDPPEFKSWRVPVRDTMLGWRGPLQSETADSWMRTIDTLLALDPPESWVALTKPLTANPDHLPDAMKVPVRGLAGHFEALSREFELFEIRNQTEHGFALWQGAGISLEAWPDAVGKSTATKIRSWRRDVLFRWLMDHSRGTRAELAETRGRVLLKFSPEQQAQIATSVAEWARLACEEVNAADGNTKLTESRPLMIVQLLYPYLAEHEQAEIGHQLIPVLLRPDLFHSRRSSIRLDLDWAKFLWKIHPLMNADERKILQTRLTPIMGNLSPSWHSSAILLCVDAWSDMPALSPEKWLAVAWHFKCGWQVVPKNTPHEQLDPFAIGPLPIPPLADHVVGVLAQYLDTAFSTGDRRTFLEKLNQQLNGSDSSAALSTDIRYRCYIEIEDWRKTGVLASHSVAELLKMKLYLRGLHELDDEGLRALKELARNGLQPIHWGEFLYRTNYSDNPWSDVLQDPQTAAREAVRWIGHERNCWLLYGLLFSMEKSPPGAAVVHAIWNALRQRSQSATIQDKPVIFAALFRLSRLLPRDERLAMRRDFLAAFRTKGFRSLAFTDDDNWGISHDPWLYPGGGLGVPWEDDELSAALSWSSNFDRQVHLYPSNVRDPRANDVFHFLSLGSKSKVFPNPWNQKPSAMPPPPAPFEPTPWQQARELHLRRPDLDFR